MSLPGRYYGERDLRFINSISAELMRNIIETLVVCYKIATTATTINIYGESSISEGKSFYDGIELSCIIDRGDISSEDEGFGPDRDQPAVFKFRENSCNDANYYPETGDIIFFNNRYHEINNIVQEQLLGGQSGKSYSFICNTQYSRLTKLNILSRS